MVALGRDEDEDEVAAAVAALLPVRGVEVAECKEELGEENAAAACPYSYCACVLAAVSVVCVLFAKCARCCSILAAISLVLFVC